VDLRQRDPVEDWRRDLDRFDGLDRERRTHRVSRDRFLDQVMTDRTVLVIVGRRSARPGVVAAVGGQMIMRSVAAAMGVIEPRSLFHGTAAADLHAALRALTRVEVDHAQDKRLGQVANREQSRQ
jgi:hypothetical protein